MLLLFVLAMFNFGYAGWTLFDIVTTHADVWTWIRFFFSVILGIYFTVAMIGAASY